VDSGAHRLQITGNRVAFRHEIGSQRAGLQGEAGPSGLEPTHEGGGKLGMSARPVPRSEKRGYLDGQMLIAMPTMGDERFLTYALIYMLCHSVGRRDGIMTISRPRTSASPDLLVQLEVVGAAELIQLPKAPEA